MMVIIIIIIIIIIKNKETCLLSIGLLGKTKTCTGSEKKLSFSPFYKKRK